MLITTEMTRLSVASAKIFLSFLFTENYYKVGKFRNAWQCSEYTPACPHWLVVLNIVYEQKNMAAILCKVKLNIFNFENCCSI